MTDSMRKLIAIKRDHERRMREARGKGGLAGIIFGLVAGVLVSFFYWLSR